MNNIIQLSPKAEVDSGGYIPTCEGSADIPSMSNHSSLPCHMVHTDLRPFFSSTFQGLFKDKSHFFKGFFCTQFDIPGTCNQPLM